MRYSSQGGIALPKGTKNSPVSVYTALKPYSVFWRVIAPEGYKLNALMDHDLIFDDYDLRIRKLI